MIALSLLVSLITAVLLLPTLSDLLLFVRGRGSRVPEPAQKARPTESQDPPRLLFLIPAHDEELLLDRCVRSVQALAYPNDRFDAVVVADNCTDRTAEAAVEAGARCLVRNDPERRGKPHAIAWALERVSLEPYSAVVVLDADSRIDPGYAKALARWAPLEGIAVQGYNDVSNPRDSNLTRMAQVFSAARSKGINALKHRAGVNPPLGNGLCLGAGILERHGWPVFSIAEDWELYVFLTTAGVRIVNEPEARVYSQEARSLRQSSDQRKRWTLGRARVLAHRGGDLLRSRRTGFLQKLDLMAELLFPGPAVHLGAVALLAPAAWIGGIPGGGWLAVLLGASLLRLIAYTVRATFRTPEPGRALAAFLWLPGYAVWRLGVQLAVLASVRSPDWVRTDRHSEPGVEVERPI